MIIHVIGGKGIFNRLEDNMEKVNVEIEMSDEDFLILAKMAHEKDITFNQLVEEILSKALEEGKL